MDEARTRLLPHFLFKYRAKKTQPGKQKSAGETFQSFYKIVYIIDQFIPDREGKNFRRKRDQKNCHQTYRDAL